MHTTSPIGRPAPWFVAATAAPPRLALHTLAGRYVLLVFLGEPDTEGALTARAAIAARRAQFDDRFATAVLVWTDISPPPRDQLPGIRVVRDPDRAVSLLYGAVDASAPAGYSARIVLLDPQLRLLDAEPLSRADLLLQRLELRADPPLHAGVELTAPVLTLPRVFEPEFCRALIEAYERGRPAAAVLAGEGEGLRPGEGAKARTEVEPDGPLRHAARERLRERLLPILQHAFQFKATRMESETVACYDARGAGYDVPYRENIAKPSTYRRFSAILALNDDFTGGGLKLPEFGARIYRPPLGGALVFSASLLRQDVPVVQGRRFIYAPHLFDEEAARQRDADAALYAAAGSGYAEAVTRAAG